MSFWKRRKQSSAGDTGRVQKAKKSVKRSPPVAMEIKILAIEVLESGLSAQEVGELVGVIVVSKERQPANKPAAAAILMSSRREILCELGMGLRVGSLVIDFSENRTHCVNKPLQGWVNVYLRHSTVVRSSAHRALPSARTSTVHSKAAQILAQRVWSCVGLKGV